MKSFLTILLGLVPMFSFAASLNELNIKLVDGRDIKISLYENPKLIFKSTQVSLEFNNQTIEFSSNDIKDFNYSNAISGVDDIHMDRQSDFIITNDGINVIKKCNLIVHRLDGTLVMKKQCMGLFPYTDLPTGCLIITIDNISFKYLNQRK